MYLAGSVEDTSGGDTELDDLDADGEEEPDDGDTEIEIRSAEIEVVLAELGDALEQHFFRRLEVWDTDENVLVETSAAAELDEDHFELVLRLCYRLRWNPEEGIGEHWVDYPKTSDPDNGSYDRARRPDRLALPVIFLTPGQPLTLRPASAFRGLLKSGGDDMATALQALSLAVDDATDGLSATKVISAVLEEVFKPVRGTLDIDTQTPVADIVSFRAEGGSVAGLLRALQPALRLGAPDALPLRRHGSTTAAILATAEALVLANQGGALVVCDDFGDQLDAGAAEHLARELRNSCDQLWMSTRRPEAARAFRPEEMVRLSRRTGERAAYQMAPPSDKRELSVVRQLHLQLLPAMSSRSIVVFEGRHDVAALTAISQRRPRKPTPAAYGVRFVESDGHTEVVKICKLARQLGFRVVAGLDFDTPGQGADTSFTEAQQVADDVVRLPERFAIERALVHGVPRQNLLDAFNELDNQWQLGLNGIDQMEDRELERRITKALHKSGLHAQYVYLLPRNVKPKIAIRFLDTAVELARAATAGPVTLTA
ncbi:TOPRIM nucleotidyl transferase/hydrolase domain-containing protein [Allorhizocola rhizosphaerae]|uniref:TOPRIM nucleotidyl transferase/hydrolase domain-containing protein n=1 Tax=Allorhizocola rhizosphaerae TaxID=1872709 RepID=UPI0013C2B3D1|nr:TOPRIM nucleotidyl transferase/hydrolase domain-containing protein [Allorhizocola rhizosphaerae]